jgi:mono/diheme cytochrome c family protein
MRFLGAGALVLVASLGQAATLEFLRDGTVVTRLDDAALARTCGVRTIDLDDPYYDAHKRYRACPLAAVLEAGFGAPVGELKGEDVLFHALDGYVKPSTLARVAEPGGFVAFGDADRDTGFAPMGRRALDPGPFYVVWSRPEQRDTHGYPWPYELASIELTSVAKKFPHTAPTGLADGDAGWRGYAIFRTECIACHSVNGEGGTVGPDLNVPRSIVEYRPIEQVKAYIKNPATFRYGNMPAHDHLSAGDLDALVAYFRAMAARKHDPGGRP